MIASKIFLPLAGGSMPERLLRNRGRLRHAVAVQHVKRLKRAFAAFMRDEWQPPTAHKVSDYRISLTSWRPRLPGLPFSLLSLSQQTLRPKEIVVWLTKEDHAAFDEGIRNRLEQFGFRFQVSDDLKPHKKWLPMIEEGHRTPFVICDDDIIYPKDWFAALVAEDCPDAYVGVKCHQITFGPDGKVDSYFSWRKQIRGDARSSHRIFITGCGGGVIHPDRISKYFLDRDKMFQQCPRSDDIWLKAAHLSAGIPCLKTRYCFPCLEMPGTDESGLAISNVDKGGNDEQIRNLDRFFSMVPQ